MDVNFTHEDFKFDVTWFSSHFHNLEELCDQQTQIIQEAIIEVLEESFKTALQFNRPGKWVKLKYQQIDNELIAAQKLKEDNEKIQQMNDWARVEILLNMFVICQIFIYYNTE